MPTMDPTRKSKPADIGKSLKTRTNPEEQEKTQVHPGTIGSTNVGTIGVSTEMCSVTGGSTGGFFGGTNARAMDGSDIVSDYALNTADTSRGSDKNIFSDSTKTVFQHADPEALSQLSDTFQSYLKVNDDSEYLRSAGRVRSEPSRDTLQPTYVIPKATFNPNTSRSPAGSITTRDSPKLPGGDTSKSSPASEGGHIFQFSEDEDQISPYERNKMQDKFTYDVQDPGASISGRKRHASEQKGKSQLGAEEEEQRSLSYQDLRPRKEDMDEDCVDGPTESIVKGVLQAGRKRSLTAFWRPKDTVRSSADDISALGGSLPRSETEGNFFDSLSRKISKSFGKKKKVPTATLR